MTLQNSGMRTPIKCLCANRKSIAALDATASSLLNTRVNLAFTESNVVWVPLAVLILEWGFFRCFLGNAES